jgi:hypothetical protein
MFQYLILYNKYNFLIVLQNKTLLKRTIIEKLGTKNITTTEDNLQIEIFSPTFNCFYQADLSTEDLPDEAKLRVTLLDEARWVYYYKLIYY